MKHRYLIPGDVSHAEELLRDHRLQGDVRKAHGDHYARPMTVADIPALDNQRSQQPILLLFQIMSGATYQGRVH